VYSWWRAPARIKRRRLALADELRKVLRQVAQQRQPSCGLPAAGGGWLPVARWKKSVKISILLSPKPPHDVAEV